VHSFCGFDHGGAADDQLRFHDNLFGITPFAGRIDAFENMPVAFALLMVSCGHSAGEKVETCPTVTQQELFLNRENDGQHVYANVGQQIVICLQTIGGDPTQISSKAIRFDNVRQSRTREARHRSTISPQLPREKPKSESRTQIQTPLLSL
jgi:hypothetical protein